MMHCLNLALEEDLILISFKSCWLKATTAQDYFSEDFEIMGRGSNTMVEHSNTDFETWGVHIHPQQKIISLL